MQGTVKGVARGEEGKSICSESHVQKEEQVLYVLAYLSTSAPLTRRNYASVLPGVLETNYLLPGIAFGPGDIKGSMAL